RADRESQLKLVFFEPTGKRAATMDNADHVALPKGIVVNTSTIYQEVANFPQVPPDQVWKYWKEFYSKQANGAACRDQPAG
ncbi:unnamed protein product, partial [Clonostachys rhizophaga]